MFQRLKHFDAYPKPLEDFRVRTTSGALLTFGCTLLITLLFFFEWSAYMNVDVGQELFVDLTRNQKLTINLNITFPHLHCYLMSLDVLDASGDNRNDVVKGLKKIRIDKDGNIIGDHGVPRSATATNSTHDGKCLRYPLSFAWIELFSCDLRISGKGERSRECSVEINRNLATSV